MFNQSVVKKSIISVLLVAVVLQLIACFAAGPENDYAEQEFFRTAARAKGGFNGVWNLTLKPLKDTCKLGAKKAVKTQAAIKQNGSKAVVKIKGLPNYSGSIRGNRLTASGRYNAQGMDMSGIINATLRSKKKLNISNSKVNIRSGNKSCYVTFKGTGTRKK